VNTPGDEAREKARRRLDEEIYPELMAMVQRQSKKPPP
jgi:hypothetical protein